MKSVFFALVLAVSVSAHAKAKKTKRSTEQRICDSFQAKVDLECAHIMCDAYIEEGSFKDLDECQGASDYAEAAQAACEDQDTTVENLVAEYNKNHPGQQVKCD
jgi:hypothetical protein